MTTMFDVRRAFRSLENRRMMAKLYRMEYPGDTPTATGAYLVFGPDSMEIRGLITGLPNNIRIESEQVLASSETNPDAWEVLDEEDADVLRAFTVLDPRLIGRQVEQFTLRALASGNELVTCRINLRSWRPAISARFLEWLEIQQRSAAERQIWLEFHNDDLVKLTSPDLPPRGGDLIVALFEIDRELW